MNGTSDAGTIPVQPSAAPARGTPPAVGSVSVVAASPTRNTWHNAWAFLVWVLGGFGLIPMLYRRLFRPADSRFKNEEIVVYSVHRSFFLWPLILIGFAGGAIISRWP